MKPFSLFPYPSPKYRACRACNLYSLSLLLSVLSIPAIWGAEQRQEGLTPEAPLLASPASSLATSSLTFLPEPMPGDRDLHRQALLHTIIETTEAEYDWVRQTRRVLGQELAHIPDAATRTSLEQLSRQIKDPEKLLFFRPGEGKEDLFVGDISPQHRTFQALRELTGRLEDFLSQVSPSLQKCFQALKAFYVRFMDRLCTATPLQKKELLAPKVSLIGEGLDFYAISQERARELISKDLYGFKDKRIATGMRSVRSRGGVHFKCFDEALDDARPGQEYMAYAFATALTSYPLVTPSVLLRVDNVSLFQPEGEGFLAVLLEAKRSGQSLDEALAQVHLLAQGEWKDHVTLQSHQFFIQASQTAGEKNLEEMLKQSPDFTADPLSLGWHYLFALLTHPGDGKADNYSVIAQEICQIIGIDNDKLFYPALYKTRQHLYTGINCALYTVDRWMGQPLADEVRQDLLKLSPAAVLCRWLGLLARQNQTWQGLIEQGTLSAQDLHTLGLPLLLPPGWVAETFSRLTALQRRLRDFPASSAHDLLRTLVPEVAEYYGHMRRRYPWDPQGAMVTVYKAEDERGTLQTVDTVSGLAPDHTAWATASAKRTPEFTQSLADAVRQLMGRIALKDLASPDLAQLIGVLIQNFNGQEDELLPQLPSDLWHRMVQAKAGKDVFAFLLRRDPAGLDRLDDSGKTPLDYAFDHLAKTGKTSLVISLIKKGASSLSLGGRQYRNLKKKHLPQKFWESFKILQRRNAKLDWSVTLEEIFPLAAASAKAGACLQGTSGEKRGLTPALQKQLDDPRHRMAQGRRDVIRVEQGGQTAYIKLYPELVGLEEAIGDLTRRLIGFGAPHGELMRFPDGRPAWVSQGILGDNLHTVLLHDPQRLARLDPASLSPLVLMAMLTNPEDGKPDNYIVEPLPDQPDTWRLACPDNDHGFVPAFVKPKPDPGTLFKKPGLTVQVKSILYCLDIMNQPIPDVIRQKFMSQNPLAILQDWLEMLRRYNQKYAVLYPEAQEISRLLKDHQCVIGIPFQKGMVGHLYSKWVRLQDALHADPEITHLELLSRLEPRLANRYREAFRQKPAVFERFLWVDGPFYGQGKGSLTTITPSGSILASQNIPFEKSTLDAIRSGEALGPEQALKELAVLADQQVRQGLSLAHMASDIQRESFLKEFDFGAQPLSGQRQILEQVTLYAAGLRSLTLKNCTPLTNGILQKQLFVGQLVQLDLRGCPQVTESLLPLLAQNNPGLEVLNLSGVPKLKWVADDTPVLGYKPLLFMQLCQLNLNECMALQGIDLEAPRLRHLWADQTTSLKTLKLKAPALQQASFEGSALTDEMLYRLLGQSPSLTVVRLDTCARITETARKVYRTFLNDPTLTSLYLWNNQIGDAGATALGANTTLTSLDLSGNQIGAAGKQALRQSPNPHLRNVNL